MALVDGKKIKARYTSLKLNEISSVDNPAQPGAIASIVKRAEPGATPPADPSILARAVAKYVGSDDGAHTFSEVLQANQFDEKIWPLVSALSQSIGSIMGDSALKGNEREAKVTASVDQFLASVRAISPEVADDSEKRLARMISKKEPAMTDLEKALAKVAELTGQLTSATALATAEKARADTAEAALTAEKTAHETTTKALVEATDETVKVGGEEIRKSVVGDGQFKAMKALASERDLAQIEKRVETDFSHVAGTTAEKAAVLKAAATMDEETRKALDAILASAEKMAALGFDRIGANGGPANENVEKAASDFNSQVEKLIADDPKLNRTEAMKRVREAHPELVEQMNAA